MATLLVSAGLFATNAAASAALVNTAVSAGLGLVQRALQPDQVVKQEGPRLAQSQITGSTEGSPIIRVEGSMRIGGMLIWATTFNETVVTTTEERGGKGGPKAVTTTTEYVYDASFAIGLCEADGDVQLGRVWFDGKQADLSRITYRFYDGTQTTPDPKMEAVEGAGNNPAYKGLSYIIFESAELTDYGNRIPQVTVEVYKAHNWLSQIIVRACQSVGVWNIDVSAIRANDIIVPGMLIGSITSPRAVLENLALTYLFDSYETDGVLVFSYKKNATLLPFDLDDTVPAENGDSYTLSRVQDEDLPDRTQLDFLDPSRDYGTASVSGVSVTGNSRRVAAVSSLAAFDISYARFVADILTHEAWIGRDSVSLTVPFGSPITQFEYLSARPGTLLVLEGVMYRVVERSIGDDIQIQATAFGPDIYGSDFTIDVVELPSQDFNVPVEDFDATDLVVAELPLMAAESPAPYSPRLIAYQDPWPAAVAVFQEDGSGGYALNTSLVVSGVIGTTFNAFDAAAPFVWDNHNTLTVRFDDPDYNPASLSDESVFGGANTLAILTPSGDWEVFQFADAELNVDGSYTLSRFLRGQLGTEPYIATSCPAGSTLVLYRNTRWGQLAGSSEIVGKELPLRYGPSNVNLSDDRYQDVTITPKGVAYRPYAPAHLRQVKDAIDITFSWLRRTRFGGDSWETDTVPLNEDFERYRVTVYDGAVVVRQWDVDGATTTTYTGAQQTEDFGSTQTSVTWTVQQVSAIYGAGAIANG